MTLVGSVAIGVLSYVQSPDAIYTRYRELAWTEFDAGKWASADIALQRLVVVRPEDNEISFRLAQTSLKLEDYAKAAYL